MNRDELELINRRLSAMETLLAWLLAAAWLCAAVLIVLVVCGMLA